VTDFSSRSGTGFDQTTLHPTSGDTRSSLDYKTVPGGRYVRSGSYRDIRIERKRTFLRSFLAYQETETCSSPILRGRFDPGTGDPDEEVSASTRDRRPIDREHLST